MKQPWLMALIGMAVGAACFAAGFFLRVLT